LNQYTINLQKNNLRKGGVFLETNKITGCASRKTALFLRENRRGSVLMANSAGIYLQLDGQILLLCDESWGRVPNGIGIGNFGDTAKKLSLAPGDAVFCTDGHLLFGERWIKIAETEEPTPAYGPKVEPAAWQAGLHALRFREKGLAPLAWAPEKTPLCALASPRLEGLCRGLLEGDTAAIDEAVQSLLGLGPGLTPSADDVLCGLLYGLLRSDEKRAKPLCDCVCRHADQRTNAVSAAYLKAIAQGEWFSRMDGVWRFFTGRGPDRLDALLEVGSSSGGDMLLGLLLAGYVLKSFGDR